MKRLPRILLALLGLVLGSISAQAQDVIEAQVIPDRPAIVAHRGLLMHAPENTLPNFRACLELRLGFEFDVEKTADGQLVCMHDRTVDRTTNGTGRLDELTLEEVRELDAGSWFDRQFAGIKVPTVDQVFELIARYPNHEVLIAVDLKAAGVEQEVVRLAEKHKVLPKLLFIGRTIAEPQVRAKIREVSAEAQIAAVANNRDEFSQALEAPHANWVYFRFMPSPEQMTKVRAANKRAFIAGNTVAGNLPDNWRQVTRLGLDGILTDYPLELRTTLKDLEASDAEED